MSVKKNLHIENSKYILLSVQIREKKVMIERNNNWEINITKTAKLFNKKWLIGKSGTQKLLKLLKL